jgi:hypothetical protein
MGIESREPRSGGIYVAQRVSVGEARSFEDLQAAERRHLDAQTALCTGIAEKNVAAPRLVMFLGRPRSQCSRIGYVDAAAPRLALPLFTFSPIGPIRPIGLLIAEVKGEG